MTAYRSLQIDQHRYIGEIGEAASRRLLQSAANDIWLVGRLLLRRLDPAGSATQPGSMEWFEAQKKG